MTTDLERKGYRERLDEGDVVYFVEGVNAVGGGDLGVKKGSVGSIKTPSGGNRHYPFVNIWDSPDKPPKSAWVSVALSPRVLFTAEEVRRILRDQEGPLGFEQRSIDELMIDPSLNEELAGALGGAAIKRLAEDELRQPGDPEY